MVVLELEIKFKILDRFWDCCRSGFGRNLYIFTTTVRNHRRQVEVANILRSTNVFSLDMNSSFSIICMYMTWSFAYVMLSSWWRLRLNLWRSTYFALLQHAQYKIYMRVRAQNYQKYVTRNSFSKPAKLSYKIPLPKNNRRRIRPSIDTTGT